MTTTTKVEQKCFCVIIVDETGAVESINRHPCPKHREHKK